MRETIIVAFHQIRLLSKTPFIAALFVFAPLGLIFVFGQAFSGVFESSGAGIRAIDYFGTTLLTLSVFQGTYIATWGMSKERKHNTTIRLGIAPVPPTTLLFGTFLGSWVILIVLSIVVAVLSALLLSTKIGAEPSTAVLAIAGESFLAASLGVSLSALFRDERTSNAIINTLVPLLVFLGGGYFLIPESGFLHDISYISPVRWVNLSLFGSENGGGREYLLPALMFCMAVSAILLAAGVLVSRRKK